MSDDEKATIIGRMVLESKSLVERSALLEEEIRRFATGLLGIATRIQGQGSTRVAEPIDGLLDDEIQLLQNHDQLNKLLAESATLRRRYFELQTQLSKTGVSVR